MDIAYYLSELLGELGEVNVPGLGNFTQQKIGGYYNSTEGKFYPPGAEINYSRHFEDDDILAEHIAEKKKISLASSKYFIEKYSNKVSVEVMMEDVQIAGLGWIYPIGDGLAFRKAPSPITPPAYYGFPQIELQQLGSTSFLDQYNAYTSAPKDEAPRDFTAEEPVAEPGAINNVHDKEHIAQPVLQDEPVAEPEQIIHEEPPLDIKTDITPAGDPVDLIIPEAEPFETKEEPVKAPLDFGASMEDYLRELEGGAYVAGPEMTEPHIELEPSIEIPKIEATPEPLIEITEPELIDEPVAEISEPENITEPVAGAPETESVPEQLTDVPFPEHIPSSYTPDAEYEAYILDKAPPGLQQEQYKQPVITAKTSQEEEEFVFDGKGYDDVDTRRKHKRSYLWLWITLGIMLILAGAAAFVYYRHEQKVKMMRAAEAAPKPVVKTDTLKKATAADSVNDTTRVIRDTTQKGVMSATGVTPAASAPATSAPAPPATNSAIDSTKVRYELIGTKCKTRAEADLRVRNYKSLDITDAHIVTGPIFGRLIKVSLGTYQNRSDAVRRMLAIIKTGKIRSIDLEKINPKK